jgi:hypothetical protein
MFFHLNCHKMKKIVVLLGVILLFTAFTDLKAQSKLRYGVKTSFSVSTLISPYDTFNLRPGFSVGAFVKYGITDYLGVGFEPAFALSGANKIDPLAIHFADEVLLNDVYGVAFKKHNLKFSTIELPLLVTYNLKLGNMGLTFSAGPSFNFILGTTEYSLKENVTAYPIELAGNPNIVTDVSARFTSYDVPLVIGIGTEFLVGGNNLSIDLRYHNGFMDINNVESKPSLFTRGFSLNISFGLDGLFSKN